MSETACTESEGCNSPVYARQLCTRHYQRHRAAGTLPPSSATERDCAHCGRLMAGRSSARAKFCSADCKDLARTSARRAERTVARSLRRCAHCDAPIPSGAREGARFCRTQCNTDYQNAKRSAARWQAIRATRKPCKGCGGPIPDGRNSRAVYCGRECMTRDVRALNYDPDLARDYNRRYSYGISSEEFDVLLAAQSGKCAICGTDEWPGKGNAPHVDHCHATGRVRGILCGLCNNGLGNFRDDPARLRRAADYLER